MKADKMWHIRGIPYGAFREKVTKKMGKTCGRVWEENWSLTRRVIVLSQAKEGDDQVGIVGRAFHGYPPVAPIWAPLVVNVSRYWARYCSDDSGSRDSI